MGWPVGWTDPAKACAAAWPGWPMGQGPEQHAYEPSRTVPKGSLSNRAKRVEMVGNGVDPHCAAEAFFLLLAEAAAA